MMLQNGPVDVDRAIEFRGHRVGSASRWAGRVHEPRQTKIGEADYRMTLAAMSPTGNHRLHAGVMYRSIYVEMFVDVDLYEAPDFEFAWQVLDTLRPT